MTIAQVQSIDGRAFEDSVDDERDLIDRAKRDAEGFSLLYQRYCPLLLNYVHRRTGDVHVTEDLVADVFVIVMRSLPGYRYRGKPFRSWLLRIATNVVNRWARGQRRRAHVSLQADHVADLQDRSTSGQASNEFFPRNEYFQRALLSLPPRYQAVLSLYYLEDLSVKETAEVVGCREGTVRSRLARARNALRSTLMKWSHCDATST